MSISKENIAHIAKLSRLKISDEKLPEIEKNMQDIIEMVDEIESLDLSSVSDKYEIGEIYNVLRNDVIKPSMTRDALLENAPDKEAGCFVVPKVVE